MTLILVTAILLFLMIAIAVGVAALAIYLVSRSKFAPAAPTTPHRTRSDEDDSPFSQPALWDSGQASPSSALADTSWTEDSSSNIGGEPDWSPSGASDFGGGGASDSWGSSDAGSSDFGSSDSGSSSSSSE
jgi:hypothetical protein